MSIDVSKFYLARKSKLPNRTAEEFKTFQAQNTRNTSDPVPIKYDRPDRVFDRNNPVWYSIRDFVEYARAIPGWQSYIGEDDSETFGGKSWDWGFRMNDCLALYDKGWSEGFEAIKHGMEQAAIAAMTAAMKEIVPARDMHGAFVDIDAYIRGEPDCMFEFQEEVRPVLHVELEIDNFIVCTTEADEVFYRGVAIMTAIMALRRMGVFVTAYVKEIAYTELAGRDRAAVTATIHIMNQNLTENMAETLLLLCHPGFRRRVYFHAIMSAWGGTDSGVSWNRRDVRDFSPVPGSGKIVIPGHFKYNDTETGIDWGNSWASPQAAEAMVHMLLRAAAAPT